MTERFTAQQRLVVAIAVLGSFVSFLDGTIVNVALPAIDRELGGGLATQQWVADAYLVTLGALILLAGSVSDAFGRILVLRWGLVGFGVASIAVALAPSAVFLIVARAVQGAAAAFLVPSSLALITSTIRGSRQARAIGVWTALTTSAMVAGPLIGGLFVDHLSWRFAFLVNVLPIAVTLWLLPRVDARDRRVPGAKIDWWSGSLCTVGLGLAVFALIEEPNAGWGSPLVWAPFAAGLLLLGGFVWRQRVAASPLLPLGLFRIRNFSAGNIATWFVYAALSLNGFVIAIYLQQGAGLSATLAGLASLPTTILMVALSSRFGALSGRIGPRLFMTAGPLVMAAGSLLFLRIEPDFDYWWQVLPGMLVFGLGLSITVAPLTAAILGSVDASRSGIASAVNNAVSRIAGLVAIAAVAAAIGGSLDLDGFHRSAVITAVLLAAGGVAALIGIRNAPALTPGPGPGPGSGSGSGSGSGRS
ncbi:MFS transporter [Microbacterium sp. SORGH_AS_0888]|uniref:MFS transporter n=1 Tax=Microbacterium sp. SORGH_AS_0888 TaxID=3041791 RepID=UPI0027805084|nr:MFS transporter [Microbacterium sp. SORGH_AS_0888]MDQ1130231.1 EmrB/QacA subfamily drug resistance transporter [Microbacterium sp. SORGH_AS_0888]